ncbi:MAG: hypothetical protein EZS28_045367 [Streblomastix strix]|uniref:Uncharacterized protein n=1 Tax=Streblomastix strix TaxID=222440 RepID=A0A5J4TLK7_9EUKA|nr:MAG: hypothetical protein EZS28_045367 [Streblomastix strix]
MFTNTSTKIQSSSTAGSDSTSSDSTSEMPTGVTQLFFQGQSFFQIFICICPRCVRSSCAQRYFLVPNYYLKPILIGKREQYKGKKKGASITKQPEVKKEEIKMKEFDLSNDSSSDFSGDDINEN